MNRKGWKDRRANKNRQLHTQTLVTRTYRGTNKAINEQTINSYEQDREIL